MVMPSQQTPLKVCLLLHKIIYYVQRLPKILYESSRHYKISRSVCPSGFLMYVSVRLFVRLLDRVVLRQSKCTLKCFVDPQTGWRRCACPAGPELNAMHLTTGHVVSIHPARMLARSPARPPIHPSTQSTHSPACQPPTQPTDVEL